MKTGLLAGIFFIGVFLLGLDVSYGCNVCHSKNPKMVAMHERPENKACFSCHGRGIIKSKRELPDQMVNDPLCSKCHKV